MAKAKLELTKDQATRLPAANELAGTVTVEAFTIRDAYHVTIRGTAESIFKCGLNLATLTPDDIKAFNERKAKRVKK